MKLNILIHDDWELYGDGSGDIEQLMFRPAREALRVCDEVGAKYTFFAEIGQQLAMKNSPLASHHKFAETWEKILTDAVRNGHDVQLHLHPQWIGAQLKGERFELNPSTWSLARLDRETMKSALKRGIDYLHPLLSLSANDYSVVAFRAGGYMIQPSTTILSVLRELKILADTTVIKGMKMENATLGGINFVDAPSAVRPWFPDSDDVAKESSSYNNLFCLPTFSSPARLPIPIYSFMINPLSLRFYWKQRRFEKQQGYTPVYMKGVSSNSNGTNLGFFGRVFRERPVTCDFGLTHVSTILRLVDKFEREAEKFGENRSALILYTHSKQLFSIENFRKLLQAFKRRGNIQFRTTRELVQSYHREFRNGLRPGTS